MTVDFSRTFVLAGEPSHVASIAIVDPEHFYPDAPHSRCAYRRAAKSHRTPQIVREGLLRMSPMNYTLQPTPYTLLINPSPYRLLEWAKRSHIQSLIYALPATDNQLTLEYWVHDNSSIGAYRLEQSVEIPLAADTIAVQMGDYQCQVPISLLQEAHRTIQTNLAPLREKTAWD
ncbi:MAG: hypothetical protein IIU96_04365, partial [Paludibacteraceae bacterium]|nr:hypothetical protein [Paludibacteraceae bacterium]